MNFLKGIEKFNSNICLISKNKKNITYKEVIIKSDEISKNLNSRSLIFVLADNNTEFFISYISFFRKGLVQMLLNPKTSTEILASLIDSYEPSYIFTPNSRIDDFKNYKILKRIDNFTILKSSKDNYYLVNKDLALLLSTSGSTGSKKFVRISYENIHHNTKSIVNYLEIKKNHRTITTMPPFYTYGLSVINTHLFSGASILVTDIKAIEKLFWKLIKDCKITSFAGVPFFYEILHKIKFNKFNLPNLKYFTQAGGSLRKELIEYFLKCSEKNKNKFIIMYGQTEATARMTYLPSKMLKKKIGSIGIPIPGGNIKLLNSKVKNTKKGEIIYSGKNVSLGYAKSYRDLNKENENKGVLKTGDLATRDSDGYLYIVGRKSRYTKIFGHRVSLDEIENILVKRGYNCLCGGFEEKIIIFYIDESYNNVLLKYIAKATNIHISRFRLKYISQFPLNENGKVSYKKLEKFYDN